MEKCTDPDDPVLFSNGYTYSGHPVACAAALKNIEILEEEGILNHVKEIAPYFQKRLRALSRFSIVGDARGMGLLGCIEGKAENLEAERQLGQMIDDACEERGLLVRPLINMAVFSPPLIITIEQIDEMFDILEQALEAVERQLSM
jgi:adenosylmethionine-8-amino-7-oxononanoate aminotransferase